MVDQAPEIALERVAEAVTTAGAVALACHVHPDGDALGSLLAFHLLCRAHGVASVASWGEPFAVAPHYRFLPGLDLASPPGDFPADPELMITFDCGSRYRLGGGGHHFMSGFVRACADRRTLQCAERVFSAAWPSSKPFATGRPNLSAHALSQESVPVTIERVTTALGDLVGASATTSSSS